MKRRHLIGGAASLCAAPAIVGTARGQTKELRMGTPFVNGSNLHQGMQKFAEVVNGGSGGKYKILVYTDSQIGDINQLLSGMQLGTVDMAYLGTANGGALKGGGPLNIAYTPYLFSSKANAERIINGPIFTPMFDDLAKESGVRVFCAGGARSGRAIQTVKGPITRPDDLKGFRLRIPPIPIFKDAFESIGVRPVPMGLADIYQALSRGQIDGQDNGFDLSLAFKWHEVAKFWSATDHVFELAAWYMSEKLWATMTPGDRELFVRAGREGGDVVTALEAEITRNGIEELKKNGVTYVVADVPAFRTAFLPSIRNYEGKQWPEGLVARIHAMQT
jgi:TRAP-type C4-dicarboxylate transport system substrate-binding protein